MKFVRFQQTWRVRESLSGEGGTLEELVYRRGYRVDGVCKELGCSQRYLYDVFMRDIGLPPKQWIDRERMVAARRMLVGGDSIPQVADKLGYASNVAFTRRFEKVYGVPPGRFVRGHKLFDPAELRGKRRPSDGVP